MPRFAPFIACLLLVGLIALSRPAPPATAAPITQTRPPTPLIITVQGEMRALNPDDSTTVIPTRSPAQMRALQLTDEDAVMSPDGRYLLYRDVPEFFAVAWNNNETGNVGILPTDLILVELATGNATTIASHPDDAVPGNATFLFNRGGVAGRAMTFAPDSSAIAYSEVRRSCQAVVPFCARTMLYDITSGEARELAFSPEPGLEPVSWTAAGIIVERTVYAPSGAIVHDNRFLSDSAVPVPYHLVTSTGIMQPVDQFGIPDPEPFVFAFGVLDDTYYSFPGFISKVSRLNPTGSILLLAHDNDTRPREVYNPDGERIYFPDSTAPFETDFVLSPDGQFVAFTLTTAPPTYQVLNTQGAVVWEGQGRTLAWGPLDYTVGFSDGRLTPGRETGLFEDVSACGPLDDVGLTPGGVGYMLPGNARLVRAAPSQAAPQIGTIPGNVTFAVVDGQQNVCNGGFRWAQVEFDGVRGWTAQGASFAGGLYMEAR